MLWHIDLIIGQGGNMYVLLVCLMFCISCGQVTESLQDSKDAHESLGQAGMWFIEILAELVDESDATLEEMALVDSYRVRLKYIAKLYASGEIDEEDVRRRVRLIVKECKYYGIIKE